MLRRDFLKTASLAVAAVSSTSEAAESRIRARVALEPFDYDGVQLRPSRWLSQLQTAREFYLNISDDDILHGWRVAAGAAMRTACRSPWLIRNQLHYIHPKRRHRTIAPPTLNSRSTASLARWTSILQTHALSID